MGRRNGLAWLAAIGLVLGLAPLRESSPAQARDGSGSVWNGDIYVVNADGSARTRLTRDPAQEFDPAWSPDGTKIAFSRFTEGRYQIFVMNADGTNAVQLTHGDARASDAAWSPDGSRIAYTRCQGPCDIHVMNADGSGVRRLTYGERPGDQSPTWSPDGRRIAFADLMGLFVMNADGGDWQRLTDGPADDSDPAWSPTGPEIAFDGSRGLFNGDIYVVNADGSGMANLTDSLPLDSNPSWSPDGTRLAYSWLTACIVPTVAGKPLQEARGRIDRASCSVGRVRFKASARPRGTVLFQQPRGRAERRIGTKVNLVASRGR